ncbi:hypothetical protein AVEN_220746-1 [Araneus ventricosus]|uniref:Uncharacterized protein n=1 Tax=Araneus ventricosus TaxID=182803 RepID=A0A4Y2X6N4_ARAVE|nr:hypothetical protein AVEN_220746-1 [Araneus ventricosus]
MDNFCLKCGGLYFRDEKNTRGIYTYCCHNGNIIEQASVYPVGMKRLMDGSDELSVHFKITEGRTSASMGEQIAPSIGRGAYCFRIHGQIYHRTSHLHPDEAGGESTNTTHFNNIITPLGMCHVTSGIIRFSPCNAGSYS